MNLEQALRWQDFAVRMATSLYADHKRPSGQWIKEQVEGYFYTRVFHFDGLQDWVLRVIDWDSSGPDPSCEYGYSDELVTDSVTTYLDDERPSPRCRTCQDTGSRLDDDDCRCDEVEDLAYSQWDEQFGGPVRCCIRAGLDVAVAPSAGVVGFNLGDLRKMYPEGLPEWVEAYLVKDAEPGVEVAALGDDEPAWL